PFTDELDRRHFREAAVTSIRMHEAAGAQQIFLAGQPFAPWTRGDDLEAFIEKMNEIPIGPGGTPVFSAHQMCSAKLGDDPRTAGAKPTGELRVLSPLLDGDDEFRDPWPWSPPWMRILARIGLDAGNREFARKAAHIADLVAQRNPGVATLNGTALHVHGLLADHPALLGNAAPKLRPP